MLHCQSSMTKKALTFQVKLTFIYNVTLGMELFLFYFRFVRSRLHNPKSICKWKWSNKSSVHVLAPNLDRCSFEVWVQLVEGQVKVILILESKALKWQSRAAYVDSRKTPDQHLGLIYNNKFIHTQAVYEPHPERQEMASVQLGLVRWWHERALASHILALLSL